MDITTSGDSDLGWRGLAQLVLRVRWDFALRETRGRGKCSVFQIVRKIKSSQDKVLTTRFTMITGYKMIKMYGGDIVWLTSGLHEGCSAV
jgi:hypothetical protein